MIEKSVVLPCPPEKAFRLFTERISEWWPVSHRPSKDPASMVRIEPMGRFCETASDGREHDLGFVREWQPPSRLVLDFYPGTDPQHPTEVTVRFTPDDGGTRVTVEHRPTEASRDLWESRAPRFVAGWDAVLAALRDHP
jgi:uncharacterized protein YndB with AHSA1/START domain